MSHEFVAIERAWPWLQQYAQQKSHCTAESYAKAAFLVFVVMSSVRRANGGTLAPSLAAATAPLNFAFPVIRTKY
jgi:hypothetical protein